MELQIDSIEPPMVESPEALALTLALVARAQTMGFLPDRDREGIAVDPGYLEELARLLRRHGVATTPTAQLARATKTQPIDHDDLVEALRATVEAIDASPRPDGEWKPARETLGDELLARLVRVSVSSLRRYASGERRTPDETAWRLHVVARLLASLIGSYNAYGVRRWFERPRTALRGATPAEILERAEREDQEQVQAVVALADMLTGAAGGT